MAAGHLSLFPDSITESHDQKNGIGGFSMKILGKYAFPIFPVVMSLMAMEVVNKGVW